MSDDAPTAARPVKKSRLLIDIFPPTRNRPDTLKTRFGISHAALTPRKVCHSRVILSKEIDGGALLQINPHSIDIFSLQSHVSKKTRGSLWIISENFCDRNWRSGAAFWFPAPPTLLRRE